MIYLIFFLILNILFVIVVGKCLKKLQYYKNKLTVQYKLLTRLVKTKFPKLIFYKVPFDENKKGIALQFDFSKN